MLIHIYSSVIMKNLGISIPMVHMKSQKNGTRETTKFKKLFPTTAHNLLQHQCICYHSNNHYTNSIYVTIATVTIAKKYTISFVIIFNHNATTCCKNNTVISCSHYRL